MGIWLTIGTMAVSGCGFTPVYGTHVNTASSAAAVSLRSVRVDPVRGGVLGHVFHAALEEKLNPTLQPMPAVYGLDVTLHSEKIPAMVERDGRIVRYYLRLMSQYRLYRIADGSTLDTGTLRRTDRFNRSQENLSTYVAEHVTARRSAQELAEQYRAHLATYLAQHAAENVAQNTAHAK